MLFVVISVLLIPSSSATEVSAKGLYLIQNDTIDLYAPDGDELVSGNSMILGINGNTATAKKAGITSVYSVSSEGIYHKLYDVTVVDSNLQVLFIADVDHLVNRLNFSQISYVNETHSWVQSPFVFDLFCRNKFSSYDVIIYGDRFAGGGYSYNKDPFFAALNDANDTGTLLLTGLPGYNYGIGFLSSPGNSYYPDFFDYRFLPEITSDADYINSSFCKEYQNAAGIVLDPYNIPKFEDSYSIIYANNISPLITKQTLEKMIYSAREHGVDSSILEKAESTLKDSFSTPIDCIQEIHRLKAEIYNNASISSVKLNHQAISLKPGDYINLSATVYMTAGKASDVKLRWESSDPDVAVVNECGVVKATGFGDSVITVFAGDFSDECHVTVGKFLKFYVAGSNYESTSSIATSYVPSQLFYEIEDFSIHYFDHSLTDVILLNSLDSTYGYIYDLVKNEGSLSLSSISGADKGKFDKAWSNVTVVHTLGGIRSVPTGVYYSWDQTAGGAVEDAVPADPLVNIFPNFFLKYQNFKDLETFRDFKIFMESGEIEREALKTLLRKCDIIEEDTSFETEYTAKSRGLFLTELKKARDLYVEISLKDASGLELPTTLSQKVQVAEAIYDLKKAMKSLEYESPGIVKSVDIGDNLSISTNRHAVLKANVSGINLKEKKLIWKSSNETVATVNSMGVVSGHSPGVTTITAISVIDENVFDSCEITVNVPVKSISTDYSSYKFQLSDDYLDTNSQSLTVQAFIDPINAIYDKIVWTTSDSSIVTVASLNAENKAVITPQRPGKATITASVIVQESIFNLTTANMENVETVYTTNIDILVKIPKKDIVKTLFVSHSEFPELLNASSNMQFEPYFETDIIPAYNVDYTSPSTELLFAAENNFEGYDIIVFNMGVHDSIREQLDLAKSLGKKIICLDNTTPPYCSNSEINSKSFEKLVHYYENLSSTEKNESFLWSERFLMKLGELFESDKIKKIENWVSGWESGDKRILYIGPAPEAMEECVEDFNSSVYGGYFKWDYIKLTNVYSKDPESLYQKEIESILKSGIDINDYDVVVCDSFYYSSVPNSGVYDVSGHFADLFGFDGLVDYWKDHWTNTVFIPIRMNTNSFVFTSDNFKPYDQTIGSISLDMENIEKIYSFYYYLTKNYGNLWTKTLIPSKYASKGYVFHPNADRSFNDVQSYLKWYTNSSYYTQDAPFIGIFGFNVYNKEMGILTSYLESKGYNVIVGGGDTNGVYDEMDKYFIDPKTNESYVTCLISLKNWAMNYWDQQEGIRQLEAVNIPVIKIVGSSGWDGGSTMYDKNSGIAESTFSWMAASSNVDGMIDFIVSTDENLNWAADRAIGWTNLNQTSNSEKYVALLYYNYPPGKDDIGANYLNLMRSLAGNGAAHQVFSGNNATPILDPDFIGLLRSLQNEGYSVNFDKIPLATMQEGGIHKFDYNETNESRLVNEINLLNLVYSQGINVGSYAPGVLEQMVSEYIEYHKNIPENHNPNGSDWWGCELIPVSDYVSWLEHEINVNKTMNLSLKEELEETWGSSNALQTQIPSPENDYLGGMVWNDKDGKVGEGGKNYFVIPMVKLGDIRLMPQPNRALASDKSLDSATYHGDIAPTHQYVAFYLWLNRGTRDSTGSNSVTGIYNYKNKSSSDIGVDGNPWKADAVIHFGTHGTHEWLPGKSVGLSRTSDWGPVLLPDLPNIYPYIVANVGEGLTAEYRGNALIISHLTPPMIKTQLYGDLIEMEGAIQGYQKQKASAGGDPAILQAYRTIIIENVYSLGWQDAFSSYFDSILTKDKAGVSSDKEVKKQFIQKYLIENDDEFGLFLEDYLHTYVESIKESSLSYGMHTFGTFDSNHIAPMVWNMWSRQGLDDIFLNTYFSGEGLTSIPSKNHIILNGSNVSLDDNLEVSSKYDESHVLEFIEKVINYKDENGNFSSPGTDVLRQYLDEVFIEDVGNTEYQNKVIFFLLGPAGYFSDGFYTDPKEIVSSWKSVGIYEDLRERLFEFYWYQSVPGYLQGDAESSYKKLIAVDGSILNDSKLTDIMVTFVEQVMSDDNFSSDPYNTVEKKLASSGLGSKDVSRPWYNDAIVYQILGNNRIQYDENLRICGDSENYAILSALNGNYISPSGGNDPVQRPEVLPTGRNFYGVDPSMYSTPAAWKVGQVLGKQMIVNYYETHSKWPDTVSFMRFGVDYIRDEGTLEASLFWLLGCEPTWNPGGKFTGAVPVTKSDSEKYDEMFKIKLKNGTEVYRPRIDIVYNSAGMRDGYGSMLRHIDKAVKSVSLIDDEQDVLNNVRKNANEIHDLLIKAGVSEDVAKELSTSRVYAQELGTYEIGTGNLVVSSGKMGNAGENQDDIRAIADLYLNKMGYLYTENNWGETSSDILLAMKAMLGRADASVFSSSSNLFDSLDNDDVFQYFGVMNLASSMYDKDGNYIENRNDWKSPDMYIADTSNIDNYREGDKVVYSASEFIHKNLDARYMNPKWIEGMQTSGYSGATMFSEIFDNLYGWSVASNGALVSDSTWNKMFDLYMEQGLIDWTGNVSPYALQAMTSRMIEVKRTGYWNATDDQMKTLVETYMESVVQTGVACCHHTCGNPTFDKFMAGIMSSSLTDIPKEQQQKYWEAVFDATMREKPKVESTQKPDEEASVGKPSRPNRNPNITVPTESENNSSFKPVNSSNETGDGIGKSGGTAGDPFVSGIQMIEKSLSNTTTAILEFLQNPTFSTSNMIVILAVILVVGVVFYGFRRGKI